MKLSPDSKQRVLGELVRLGILEPDAPEGSDVFGNPVQDLPEQGAQPGKRSLRPLRSRLSKSWTVPIEEAQDGRKRDQ